MPQMFQVLRCYKCLVFQVHQIRKDNKWICKMCGEKQSVKRHYGLGSGKECRLLVQKLNTMRGKKDFSSQIIDSDDSEYESNTENSTENLTNKSNVQSIDSKESKWAAFIDKPEQKAEDTESQYYNDQEVVLEIPQKRKINRNFKQTKYVKKFIINKVYSQNDSYNDDEIDKIPMASNTQINMFVSKQPEVSYNPREKSPNINKVVENQSNEKPQIQLCKVNNTSKWAQFLDDAVKQGENSVSDENFEKNCNKNSLFTLCDDNDIDKILDF